MSRTITPIEAMELPANQPARRRRAPTVAIAGILVVAAAVAMTYTRDGLSVSGDSTTYIGVAHNLAHGDGFTVPFGDPGARLERFGPVLPVVLAGGEKLGLAPLAWAKALNVLLLLGSVGLILVLVRRAAPHSLAALVVAGLLATTNRAFLLVHHLVLSEPPYIVLELICALFLIAYIQTRRRWWLAGAAVAAAAALTTRYVGVALILAGVIVLLLRSGGVPKKRRIGDASIFAALAGTPVLGWMVLELLHKTSATGRSLTVDLKLSQHGREGLATVTEWFFTTRVPGPLRAVLLAVAIVGSIWLWRRRPRPRSLVGTPSRTVLRVLVLVAAAHATVIVAAVVLFDPNVALDGRILLPVWAPLVPVAAALTARAATVFRHRRTAIAALAVALGGLQVAALTTNLSHPPGLRLNSPALRSSPLAAAIRTLRPGLTVYSNAPDAVWFLTGRHTRWVPVRADRYTAVSNPAFGSQLDSLADEVRGGRSVVVYLYDEFVWNVPSQETLRTALRGLPNIPYAHGWIVTAAATEPRASRSP